MAVGKYELQTGNNFRRFDAEYLLWRNMYTKIAFYINHKEEKAARSKFEKLFLNSKSD